VVIASYRLFIEGLLASLPLLCISDYCLLAEQTLENGIDAGKRISGQFLILELMVGSRF
jgi:hypothetical protein